MKTNQEFWEFNLACCHEEIENMSVCEITSRDTYINNKPVLGGLFDPRMGVQDPGLICPTDGHDYINTPGYFGHITLAKPVFFIQYLTTVLKICDVLVLNAVNYLLTKKNTKLQWKCQQKQDGIMYFNMQVK